MNTDWTIQGRSDCCASTGESFAEGAYFYTLLFDDRDGFRREDISEAAWKERPEDAPKPFSFWRSKYEAPPAAPPEPLAKQTAEDLLRRYMAEPTTQHANTRYILAVMLERKRLLKEIDTRRTADGALTRIYEHTKTGEVFVIPDPELRMEQIEQVQSEVASLLASV